MSATQGQIPGLQYIIDFIYQRSGIRLHEGKEELIRARLGGRMRHHGFARLEEYCDFLRTRGDSTEETKVIDALTTNFTNFFREEDHFRFLVQHALPTLVRSGEKELHFWSAACSSGEEPYTLGFYLAEHLPPQGSWHWQIVGSDISTRMLETARNAIYAADRVRSVPPDWLRRYFQKGSGPWAGHYRVKPCVAERVAFRHLNLNDEYQHPQQFDVIFCRNVLIYFDRQTQEKLVRKMCRFLRPEGYLFIGHSESLHGMSPPLRCVSPSIYQRSDR